MEWNSVKDFTQIQYQIYRFLMILVEFSNNSTTTFNLTVGSVTVVPAVLTT